MKFESEYIETLAKIINEQDLTEISLEDGEQAIKIFEGSEIGYYDIIFMDIQMPVMDGYEATSRIRASNREDGKTVPIYAMTANTFAEDIAKARSCGMDGHIAKPIDINNVMHVLRHL